MLREEIVPILAGVALRKGIASVWTEWTGGIVLLVIMTSVKLA